jgi:hypothetical protein
MKKVLASISIILLSILFSPAFTQNSFRWADSNAVWYHTFQQYGYGYYKAIYTKDTILNNQNCQKIEMYAQELYHTSPTTTVISPYAYRFSYFLYKSNDSVFTYRNNAFYLAFKINGTVGEIWDLGEFLTFSNLHAYVMVDSVFYQNYNGVALRNIKIHACDSNGNNIPYNPGGTDTLLFAGIAGLPNYTIINEKFGPIGGFDAINFVFLNIMHVEFIPSLLLCYESANFPFFQYNSSFDCFNNIFTGIDEVKNINEIIISPNPFTQSTQITLPQTYHNIALTVYDIQGKQVAQQQYADCDKIQLNHNQLGKGLYFLKLSLDDKAVVAGKIVLSE